MAASLKITLKKRLTFFNHFFANHCTLMEKSSKLSPIAFSINGIGRTMKSLDPNKAHGHDMISILNLKICGSSFSKSPRLMFRFYIKSGGFPLEWKRGNVFCVEKKHKQILKNYLPISF